MQAAVQAKPINEKKQASPAPAVSEVKTEPANDAGAEAGMPIFLQRSFSTDNSSPPEIQRKCDACATEDEELGSPVVQPGLKIGPANDAYEQEADSVSEKVVMMSRLDSGSKSRSDTTSATGPRVQRKTAPVSIQRQCSACAVQLDQPLLQRKCSKCAAEEEDSSLVQRKEKAAEHQNNMAGVQSLVSSPGAGNRLAPDIQRQSESVLNSDLSGVRVHSDSKSNKAAKDIGAKAFTHGNNVFLGEGESSNDLGLMSHELTHTVQQSGASDLPIQRYDLGDLVGDGLDLGGDLVEGGLDIGGDLVEGGLDLGGDLVEGGLDLGGDIIEGGLNIGGDIVETGLDIGGDVVEHGLGIAGDLTDIDQLGDVGRAANRGLDATGRLVNSSLDSAGQAVNQNLDNAGEAIDNAANNVGGFINNRADMIGGMTNNALDAAADFARNGVSFSLPDMALCSPHAHNFPLGNYSHDIDLIEGILPVGPNLFITGSIGLVLNAAPSLQLSIGPCLLSNIRVTFDPFGRTSATASLDIGVGTGLMVMLQGGVRGEIGAMAFIPMPLELPLVALEAGAFGFAQASAVTQLSLTPDIGFRLPNLIDLNLDTSLELGGALDLYAGVFGNLKMLDKLLCSLIWPLAEYHADDAVQIQFSLSGILGGASGGGITAAELSVSQIPFDSIESGLKREAPNSNCPLVDNICAILNALGLLPSQRGVGWTGHPPPPVPTACNTHSDSPYLENPLIPSGAKCRGACGPDCADNCEPEPDMKRCAEDATGNSHYICDYRGVQNCGTHDGCRQHDACYDWCAADGSTSIFDSCHRWCDFGCICENDINTCIGWALGSPPFDGRMTFYNETISVMRGPFPGHCPEHDVTAQQVYDILISGNPVTIVTALASMPLAQRLHIAADPAAMQLLENAVGASLWPAAQRIANGAASVSVPSLDEATVFLADQAILDGNHTTAFHIVLETLIARGLVNATLANWSQVARSDRGEGVTNFTLTPDPVTGERRARAPVSVEIYTPAFQDTGWLYSTIMHEYLHVLQVLAGYPATEFDNQGNQSPQFVARDEVESYLWEIEHSLGSGLINNVSQMRDVGARLTTEFQSMTPAMQLDYRDRYDAAQQRVRDVIAGRPGMPIEEARRIVQESSQEIAELLPQRPGNESSTDAQIEVIRQRRAQAMIEVALVDNPAIQVVRPGDPGVYRVPTLDADGRVRYLHGGIQVAWHIGATSTSAYTLGGAMSAGGQMAVAGTAVQGRVHPFPPDIDFDEHIHVVANHIDDAAHLIASRLISSIRRISGGRVPARDDLEFRHLLTFPHGSRGIKMSLGQVLSGNAVNRLASSIVQLNGGNLNSFWRGMLADGRFTDITRVVFVSAKRPDGTDLMVSAGSDDFNLAFLQDPGEIPATNLGEFAWAMCCDAVRRANAGKWLKAGKRAYNYFSTIGDTAHMAALEPAFQRPETMVEQYATVIDGIQHVLSPVDMRVHQPRTRILTVDEARLQVENVSNVVETKLPYSGVGSRPDAIARDLRLLSSYLQPRNARGHLKHDRLLAQSFGREARAIRELIDAGVRGQVQPVIDGILRPICLPENCRRR